MNNLFVFYTQSLLGKAMLTKKKGRAMYLLSKNAHIRLWHQRKRHVSNARVVKIYKLADTIYITIDNG